MTLFAPVYGVKGTRPREYDQFFTKQDIAKKCVEFLESALCARVRDFDLILEPSFGDGAFVTALKDVSSVGGDKLKFIYIDAQDDRYRTDFLKFSGDVFFEEYVHHYEEAVSCVIGKKRSNASMTRKRCLTVGNPPFGKNASLAMAFFNHAAKFSSVIAFIVPRTFSKASVQNKLDRHFILAAECPLNEDGFLFQGQSYSVPCVFQVWVNTLHLDVIRTRPGELGIIQPENGLRPLHPRLAETPDFEFVTSLDQPDLAVRRVGVNAGRIFLNNPHACSDQSHFFIKAKDRAKVECIVQRLRSLGLENTKSKFETAGCPSISKSELCYLYINQKGQNK